MKVEEHVPLVPGPLYQTSPHPGTVFAAATEYTRPEKEGPVPGNCLFQRLPNPTTLPPRPWSCQKLGPHSRKPPYQRAEDFTSQGAAGDQ